MPDTAEVLRGYAADAAELVERYEAVPGFDRYCPLAHVVPGAPGRMADIGAGTGQDADWFAARGWDVLAVEPVTAFRAAGAERHESSAISWLDDALPELKRAVRRGPFDLVLVSGVWQHLDKEDRTMAMPALRALTAPGGQMILSLRQGPGAPSRPCFPASADETGELARAGGFVETRRIERESIQPQNRAAGVRWTWFAFTPGQA